MTQAKNEPLPTNNLNKNVLSNISSFLALPCPLFKSSPTLQKNRLLNRLAQYADEANISKVISLVTIRPDLRTEVQFTLAGLGEQDEMEPLLKQHPEDLLLYRPLRDISGAYFENISLFQHAIWTKDVRHMANMMLNCLPKNKKGEEIRLEMVRQYEELIVNGVDYQLKGVMHEKERHFSLQPLITALDTYVTHYDNWTEKERKVHWCTVVGLVQTLLPAHIRHHYCDQYQSFWDNPDFQVPTLHRSLVTYNRWKHWQLWSVGLVGLGCDFGISNGGGVGLDGAYRGEEIRSVGALRDLIALKSLDGIRTYIDMPSLIKRLYTPIQNLKENLTEVFNKQEEAKLQSTYSACRMM